MSRVPAFALVGLLLLLAACGGTAPLGGSETEAEALYRVAIEDAETAEPTEIITSLTPLVPHNDDLVWRTPSDAERQLLVVTWTDAPPRSEIQQGDTFTVEEDIWVTPAPEVQRFCEALDLSGDRLALRLAQRLGLPPNVEYDRFVSLWVEPDELVRPCPDPEVTDRECELDTPAPENHLQVSETHQEWFRALEASMYGPDGYPWTRLGYTYDWNPTTDEVGVSEFVLRPGATAEIRDVRDTESYCRVE